MTSRFFSSMGRFETNVISGFMRNRGVRPDAKAVYAEITNIINRDMAAGNLTRNLASYMRLAMRLVPYSPEMPLLMKLHDQTMRTVMETKLQGLFEIVRTCGKMGIPVPVIVSCERFMAKALELQKELQPRYFNIPPIVVRGDMTLTEEKYEAPILSLPVADSYEALPVKVFESYAFLHSIDNHCGMFKIDDDLVMTSTEPLSLPLVKQTFGLGDYMGISVHDIVHDRIWHAGKCGPDTPHVYGKPLKAAWCRGALYYLSANALEKLVPYYFRFPSCLDGEMYEDKAIADVLFDNGIILTAHGLETLLGFDTVVSPERLMAV